MYQIFIDGASRGNPGLSGIGLVILNGSELVSTYSEFLGVKTNNQAEYQALKRALQISRCMTDKIVVLSDSSLLINQRLHKYKVRNTKLKLLAREISNIEENFTSVKYEYIPREENTEADLAANSAVDNYIKYKRKNNKGSNEESELIQTLC